MCRLVCYSSSSNNVVRRWLDKRDFKVFKDKVTYDHTKIAVKPSTLKTSITDAA